MDGDVRAGAGEAERDALAHPPCAASNEDNLTAQFRFHRPLTLSAHVRRWTVRSQVHLASRLLQPARENRGGHLHDRAPRLIWLANLAIQHVSAGIEDGARHFDVRTLRGPVHLHALARLKL